MIKPLPSLLRQDILPYPNHRQIGQHTLMQSLQICGFYLFDQIVDMSACASWQGSTKSNITFKIGIRFRFNQVLDQVEMAKLCSLSKWCSFPFVVHIDSSWEFFNFALHGIHRAFPAGHYELLDCLFKHYLKSSQVGGYFFLKLLFEEGHLHNREHTQFIKNLFS